MPHRAVESGPRLSVPLFSNSHTNIWQRASRRERDAPRYIGLSVGRQGDDRAYRCRMNRVTSTIVDPSQENVVGRDGKHPPHLS